MQYRLKFKRTIFALVPLLIAAEAIAQEPPTARNPANPPRRDGPGGFALGRPAPLPAGVRAERNIPYVENGHRNQVLDLFLPEQPSEKPRPLMIWIHGGAWMFGDQANPPVLYLVSQGFAVASIQHRFSSDAIWPAQAYDCKANHPLLARQRRQLCSSTRLISGWVEIPPAGILPPLLGTSGDVKEMEGNLGDTTVSSRVQAVVDWFGPTDFTLMTQQSGSNAHDAPDSPESRLLGGPVQETRDLAKTANPLTYVDRTDPPFLIMHGDNDQLVPLGQSITLAKALIDAGVEVTMRTIHGAGHEGPEFRNAESRRLIEEFLSRTLKPPK